MSKRHQPARFQSTWPYTLLCLIWCIASLPALASTHSRELNNNWRFRLLAGDAQTHAQAQSVHWHSAQIPGAVHTDLLAHGLIHDMHVGMPEAGLQWIGVSDWEYETRFNIDAATLARRHAELVFEGLDTFAEVSLNGQDILRADNYFRTWRVAVKEYLRSGENTLRVVFRSPIRSVLPQVQAMKHQIAGNYISLYGDEPADALTANFVRKPGYHYGWDWGPRYVSMGIWRPVRLDTWDGVRIDDVAIQTTSLDAQQARLELALNVQSDGAQRSQIEIDIIDPDGHLVHTVHLTAQLNAGNTPLTTTATVNQPRRWWPVGYGEQARYTFRVRISAGGHSDTRELRTGLRTVELDRSVDGENQAFAFIINGVPVFAKGANVIPFDMFPARVSRERLRRELQSARDANMNMLRIWGGGYYQSNEFFEIADELGLMIWHDFMFGGGMPPGYDAEFRASVVNEARDNIRRLRNHPSLVMWCGNNEEEISWKNWGNRETLSAADPEFANRVWQGYVDLFGHDLRQLVAEEGLGIPYWSSSPGNDLDGDANIEHRGLYHYWDVWGGPAHPVEQYLTVTPRFMAEFGLQAWPSMRTVASFAAPGERDIQHPVIRKHQKFMSGAGAERLMENADALLAEGGNGRIMKYINNEFGTPHSFEDYVYLSQLMQAEGIELAALHHRASMPWTMGTLYWQFNDVWPGASWSSVDYFGRWKALHYHARRFFAEITVAALRKEGETTLSVVSDLQHPRHGQWRVRVMDFNGHVIKEQQAAAILAPLSANTITTLTDSALLGNADPRAHLAVFEWSENGNIRSRRLVYFDHAKHLQLPRAKIQTRLQEMAPGRYQLHLSSTQFARAIWLEFGDPDTEIEARLSDNAFDLLPGESITLTVESSADLDTLRAALRVRTLAMVISKP